MVDLRQMYCVVEHHVLFDDASKLDGYPLLSFLSGLVGVDVSWRIAERESSLHAMILYAYRSIAQSLEKFSTRRFSRVRYR